MDMFKDLFVLDLIFMFCFVKGTVLLLAFCNVYIYIYTYICFVFQVFNANSNK